MSTFEEMTPLDRMRERAEGRLSPADAARLERELALDATQRALADDYRVVHALTRAGERELPQSSVTFDVLERRMELERPTRAWPRRAAALAVIVSAVAMAVFAWRTWRAQVPLSLQEIRLEEPAPVDGPTLADVPDTWADYEPDNAGTVRWLGDVREARLLADTTQRPLFVYGSYPGCPMCAALNKEVFANPFIARLAQQCVPIQVNLATLPDDEARALISRGYPFLEMWCPSPDASTLPLERAPNAVAFGVSLEESLERCKPDGPVLAWNTLHKWTRALLEARDEWTSGRPARAHAAFTEVATQSAASGYFSALARAGLRGIANDVRSRFLAARDAAAADPEHARALLERALALYADTPFEPDLRAALERLERDGRFPPVVAAHTGS